MSPLRQQPRRLARDSSKRGRGRLLILCIGVFLIFVFVFLSLSWLWLDLSTEYRYPALSFMDWGGEILNTSLYSVTAAATPITIAYAISLVKCGDKQSSAPGLVDAALVMRHSIHMTSVRNPDSGSKYDYKMYAIVHPNADKCSGVLKDAGFEVLIKEPPVNPSEIESEFLRQNIHREWCCGSDEFIKLYAYTLPEPVVVHVDIDFAFYKPMDDLFDAIIYDKDSPEGIAARSKIPLERPAEGFPDTIGAFLTRDWPQVVPGRKPLYQAGFLVARTNQTVLDEVVNTIKTSHYEKGYQAPKWMGWSWLWWFGRGHGDARTHGLLLRYRQTEQRCRSQSVSLQLDGDGCPLSCPAKFSNKITQRLASVATIWIIAKTACIPTWNLFIMSTTLSAESLGTVLARAEAQEVPRILLTRMQVTSVSFL